jgi:predicted Zn-dependent protease with MMP-like domain
MEPSAFELLVLQQWQAVPDQFRQLVDNLSLQVETQAHADLLEEVGLDQPDDLLGLYQGCPLPERDSQYGGCLPDIIYIYQQPIEHHARREGLDLSRVIRETIVHELGHYFGFSETEMDYFEKLWGQTADQ